MMKSIMDHAMVKKSIEATARIYHLCNKFPDTETFGIVYMIKDASLSHTSAMNQLLYCTNNSQCLMYLEDALHTLRKVLTGFELSRYLELITEEELQHISDPISAILDHVCDQISMQKAEIEKEISRMETDLLELPPGSMFPLRKSFDS